MMANDFSQRVHSTDWSVYHHPCQGSQTKVPQILDTLKNGDEANANEAAFQLWNLTAHQGAACASAIPITGFIMELFDDVPAEAQDELMDTMYQYSVHFKDEGWGPELLVTFEYYRDVFIKLQNHPSEDIQTFAEMILRQMELASS